MHLSPNKIVRSDLSDWMMAHKGHLFTIPLLLIGIPISLVDLLINSLSQVLFKNNVPKDGWRSISGASRIGPGMRFEIIRSYPGYSNIVLLADVVTDHIKVRSIVKKFTYGPSFLLFFTTVLGPYPLSIRSMSPKRRMENEIRTTAKFQHINIPVPMIYGYNTRTNYIIKEHIDGTLLSEELNTFNRKGLTETKFARDMFIVGRTLSRIHADAELSLVDPNPYNIILRRNRAYFFDMELSTPTDDINKSKDIWIFLTSFELLAQKLGMDKREIDTFLNEFIKGYGKKNIQDLQVNESIRDLIKSYKFIGRLDVLFKNIL